MTEKQIICISIVFATICVYWVHAIHQSFIAPHKIITSINGHVLSSYWTTNREQITYTTASRVTSNGMEYYQKPGTNYLW